MARPFYNEGVLIPALIALLAFSQQPPAPKPHEKPPEKSTEKRRTKPEIIILDPDAPKPEQEPGADPPELYTLDPEKAGKELVVGNFYMKKGNYPAAAARFEEAVKWHPRFALAWFRLAEAREKRGELKKAVEAYQQYLELAPQSKKARDAKKAIARLEREL